eukprot:15366432-Ditylum_brightwellii.AAC.3
MMTIPPYQKKMTSNHDDNASTTSSASSNDNENIPPKYSPPQTFTFCYKENGDTFHENVNNESYSSGCGAQHDVTNMYSMTGHVLVKQNLYWDAPNHQNPRQLEK